jgi:hypothetical protein
VNADLAEPMLSVQMAQHLHDIRRNMNARANPLKGPSLFINARPEALALQQSGCSSASESGSNDRDPGFAPHGTVTPPIECSVFCAIVGPSAASAGAPIILG